MRRVSGNSRYKFVVPYNPEIAMLWGAVHNDEVVAKHGFEIDSSLV